jgi:hypothetical protein
MYKCLHFSNLSRHLGLSDSIALPGKLVVLQSDCRQEVFLILETSVTNEYNNNNNNKQNVKQHDEGITKLFFRLSFITAKFTKLYFYFNSDTLNHCN